MNIALLIYTPALLAGQRGNDQLRQPAGGRAGTDSNCWVWISTVYPAGPILAVLCHVAEQALTNIAPVYAGSGAVEFW